MTEQLEKLKKDITEIQGIMVKVSTGRGNIDDFEDEYRILYFSIKEQLKTFRENGIYLPDLNFFSSLWDFYSHWKAGLKTYQERREYIRSLYKWTAPQSISELAVLLGRDRRNVIHDLTYLKGSGFVDFEDENKAKKAKKPTVDYDAVHVTIPISRESAISA